VPSEASQSTAPGSPMYEAMRSARDELLAENQRLRVELQRIADHNGCVHWPESGCAHAMRTVAVVALGGSL
jgi:hypothetical protein